jgi:hypothetical protein
MLIQCRIHIPSNNLHHNGIHRILKKNHVYHLVYCKNTKRGDFAHKTSLTNHFLIEMPAHVLRQESEPSCICVVESINIAYFYDFRISL